MPECVLQLQVQHSTYTTRWVNANLLVQVKVCQWQLHCLTDFLLLNVQTTNVLQPPQSVSVRKDVLEAGHIQSVKLTS